MKQRVLKKFPKAFACRWKDSWVVYAPTKLMGNVFLGLGKTAARAWADAAQPKKRSK